MPRSFSRKLSNSSLVQKNGSKTWTGEVLDMLQVGSSTNIIGTIHKREKQTTIQHRLPAWVAQCIKPLGHGAHWPHGH